MSLWVPEFGTRGQKDLFLSTWPNEKINKKLAQLGFYNTGSNICWGEKTFFQYEYRGKYPCLFDNSNIWS